MELEILAQPQVRVPALTARAQRFQTDVDLTVWQRFEKIATPAVMESYQTVVLGSRQAWQFTKPLTVKILSYEPQENQVKVEMLAPGRLNATVWWLDGKDFGG